MDDKISEENDITYSAIRDALTRELSAGEFRAKRSLRVLQHQEGRISTLENELGEKFNMLQELQESHSDLMEAHRYQSELQELQKHLIKLQEIQFLTEVVQPKMNEMGKKEEKESTSQETFQQEADLNDGKFNLEKSTSRSALFKSFGTGSRQADTSHDRKNEEESSATDNAILPESEDSSRRMKFCSLKTRLGSMGSLLQCTNEDKQFLESLSPDKDDGTNYFTGINHESGAFEDKRNFRMHTRQMSTSNDDDNNDKISVLKETLSLHRQSIEDLSSEVVYLREEKSELLSHVRSLMEWKSKVENVMNASGEGMEDVNGNSQEKNSLSKKEIDVIMPVSRKSYRNNMSNKHIIERQSRNQSKHVRLNVGAKPDSDTGSEGSKSSDKEWEGDDQTASKLEVRARRIWDIASKYFTPEQAHFILTATASSDHEEESSAIEDY